MAPRPPAPAGPAAAVQLALNALPGFALETASSALASVLSSLPRLRLQLHAAAGLVPGAPAPEEGSPAAALRNAASVLIGRYIDPALLMLQRFKPLEAAARPVDGVEVGTLFPPELLLLLPVLRRKAAEGGAVEGAILSLLDRLLAPQKPQLAAVGAAAAQPASASTACSEGDALALLQKVVDAVPALADPSAALGRMGLSAKAESMARAALAGVSSSSSSGGAGEGVRAAAKWLMATVDERAWTALRPALLDVCAQRPPLRLAAILDAGSPWNRAARAVLGCPCMRLTTLQGAVAGGVGLGGVVALWREAQAARRAPSSSTGRRSSSRSPGRAAAGSGGGTGRARARR